MAGYSGQEVNRMKLATLLSKKTKPLIFYEPALSYEILEKPKGESCQS